MTEEWKGHFMHIKWREMNTFGAFWKENSFRERKRKGENCIKINLKVISFTKIYQPTNAHIISHKTL